MNRLVSHQRTGGGRTQCELAWRGPRWGVAVAVLLASAMPAFSSQHFIDINEVFTNADGSVQYVELVALASSQSNLAPSSIRSFNADGTVENVVFDFIASYPAFGAGSNGLTLLVATPEFENVFGFAPDFVMPANSLVFAPDGRVVFWFEGALCPTVGACPAGSMANCEMDAVAFGNFTGDNGAYGSPTPALPTNGCRSLTRVSGSNCNQVAWEILLPSPRRTDGTEGTLICQNDFRRGDCNGDGLFNIADPIFLLGALFAGGDPSTCLDACDSNDDQLENIADAIFTLNALFADGPQPSDPAPDGPCGSDKTDDTLGCAEYSAC